MGFALFVATGWLSVHAVPVLGPTVLMAINNAVVIPGLLSLPLDKHTAPRVGFESFCCRPNRSHKASYFKAKCRIEKAIVIGELTDGHLFGLLLSVVYLGLPVTCFYRISRTSSSKHLIRSLHSQDIFN